MGEIEPANGGFTIQIHLATFAPIFPVIKIPKISISTNPHFYLYKIEYRSKKIGIQIMGQSG